MTENNDIVIKEKPDFITYKDISDILWKAHEQHRKNGIYMRVPHLPPDELEKWIGERGKCFVAMDGDKLIGTSSYILRKLNRWYYKGTVLEVTMQGVLPSYQGRHIFTMLNKACEEEIEKSDCKAIYFDTAAANNRRIKISEKDGYIMVDYFWTGNQYSIGMMKWHDKCPFPLWYCKFRFTTKRCAVCIKHALGLYKR